MIDTEKRAYKQQAKDKVRKRMNVQVDMDNYEYIPAKKPIDYYDSETPQNVGIYVRVSTDDIRQTTSYELQKKYYEDFVSRHSNWTLIDIYADEGTASLFITGVKPKTSSQIPDIISVRAALRRISLSSPP